MKCQVYNKGILPILGIFSWYEILISLECAVDSEWIGIINFAVSCSVAELFICRNHKNPAFNDPTLDKTTVFNQQKQSFSVIIARHFNVCYWCEQL